MASSKVTYSVEFEEKISRLFVFRFLWSYIEIWVLLVWTFWILLVSFCHFWHMLILGKRHKGLWQRQLRYQRHVIKWQTYNNCLANGRPDFITE